MSAYRAADEAAARAVPEPEPRRPVNLGLIVAVTVIWLALTGHHFRDVHEIAQTKGVPTAQAEPRLADKLVVALQDPTMQQYRSLIGGAGLAEKLYGDALEASPENVSMRCHYAVLLEATSEHQHALDEVGRASKLAKSDDDRAYCKALLDALDPKAPPLDAPQRTADMKAVQTHLSGWPVDFVAQRLDERAGDTAAANRERDIVTTQAADMSRVLLRVSAWLLGSITVGLLTLLFYVVVGRKLNLRSDVPDADWDPAAGWGAILVYPYLAGTLVQVLIGLGLRAAGVTPPERAVFLVGMQFLIYAITIAAVGVLIRGRFRQAGVHFKQLGRNMLTGALLFTVALVLVYIGAIVVSVLLKQNLSSENPVFLKLTEAFKNPIDLIAMLLLVGFMGPLFEEFLFRGVIYSSMRQIMRPALAIPLNGIVFALAHGDLNALVPLAVLGSLLAYCFEKTRSIFASGVTHAMWNTQTFLATWFLFS
jgi:membrane protease YdiL (CAAX protease family)